MGWLALTESTFSFWEDEENKVWDEVAEHDDTSKEVSLLSLGCLPERVGSCRGVPVHRCGLIAVCSKDEPYPLGLTQLSRLVLSAGIYQLGILSSSSSYSGPS